ncbi:MAG TPA: hypothetical protein PLP06_09790 [Saprospiraceae bacterium]|nr:hypothetical protein [Saprospiraceae bacterium]
MNIFYFKLNGLLPRETLNRLLDQANNEEMKRQNSGWFRIICYPSAQLIPKEKGLHFVETFDNYGWEQRDSNP